MYISKSKGWQSGDAGWFWCGIAGYTSFVAHSGGPPLTVYLLLASGAKLLYDGLTRL